MPSIYGGGSSGGRSKFRASNSGSGSETKKGSPSVFSRVMDILSRGQYMSAGGANSVVQTLQGKQLEHGSGFGAMSKGFGRAVSGKDKMNYSDVMKNAGIKNKWALGIGGLTGDILLDPTTYAGVGLTKIPGGVAKSAKVVKGIKGAEKAVSAVKDTEEALKLAKRTSQVIKSTKGATEVGKEVKLSTKILEKMKAAETAAAKSKQVVRGSDTIADAQRAAQKIIDAAESTAKVTSKAAPPVGDLLKLTAMPGKVATGASKGGNALKGIEAAAHAPSLFDDLIEGAGKAATGSTAIPKTAGAAADVGVAVHAAPLRTAAVEFGKAIPELEKLDPVRRALAFKVLGKPIVQSEKAYDAAAKVLRPLGASEPAQLLSRSFRTAHGLLPEVHQLQRESVGIGRQNVAAKAREAQEVYKGVTKQDQKKIYEAIQGTEVDGLVSRVEDLSPELQKVAKWTQEQLNDLVRGGDQTLPGMQGAAKFEDISAYKGGKPHDRAPQALVAQYDKVVRKDAYQTFAETVKHRFPNNPEVEASLKRSRDIFGVDGEVSAKWVHYVDNAMTHWKRWNTTYRPGFHTRNMLGDLFNANLAKTDFRRFADSAKVLKNAGKESGGGVIKIGRKEYSPQAVEGFYKRGGLETSFIETEVAGGAQNRVGKMLTNVGDQREKYTRMATFISALDKSLKKGKSMETAISEAATTVRKYHFDYTDLTPIERKLKQFIPFYTYTRKELPVLLEHTLTSPGKMIVPGKAGSAIETLLGVERDPNDPFPGIEGMLPDYMKNQQLIQRGNNKVFKPGMPTDMLSMLNPKEFVKQQFGNLTPVIKAPYELSTGESLPQGYNIKKKETGTPEFLARYAASYGPYGNLARDSKSPISERMLNLMTGAGSSTVRAESSSKSKGRSSSKSRSKKRSIY